MSQEKTFAEAPSAAGCDRDVMTVQEAASYLRVNIKTVYDAIARGELPGARRVGRKIRMSRSALVAWLAQGQGRVSRSTEKQK